MIRTRRQRPPLAVHASVSDSTPMGSGRLAPAATPSAAPYASSRSQSSTWSGEWVAKTGFSVSVGTNPEPPRCGLHARGRLALWMLPLDPAEKRERAEERHASPAWNSHAAQVSRAGTKRRGGEHREDRAPYGLARQPARLCVGDDPGDETAHPSRRLVLRAGGERLGRNDAVERADAEMVENAALVGRQPFVARLSEPT